MKTIDIIGENYTGTWNHTRIACRGIVTENGRILLSRTKRGNWMVPGGGLEGNESIEECCIRELSEEAGLLIEPSPCVLEVDEYYTDAKYATYYFFAAVIGETERKLTEGEIRLGMEPEWVPVEEAIRIFSKYDECEWDLWKGIYYREYRALSELF